MVLSRLNLPTTSPLAPSNQLKQYSISEMFILSITNSYPRKEFLIAGDIKKYTPIMHFYDSLTVFETFPTKENKMRFKCLYCHNYSNEQVLGLFTALNRHLRLNCSENVKKWYENFHEFSTLTIKGSRLTDEMLLLIKNFITSNTSLSELQDPFLIALLKATFDIPGYFIK